MKNLLNQISELESLCANFFESEEREEDTTDVTLQLKSFNQITTDCKFELLKATPGHIEHVLKSLYDLDIYKEDTNIIDTKLDSFVEKILQNSEIKNSEDKINFIQDTLKNIKEILEHLDFEYSHIITEAKLPLFFYRKKLQTLEQEKVKLIELRKTLGIKLEYIADLLAKNLIDNFYAFYIFISFLLHVKKVASSEILIVKIVSILDRYIEIITPAFNNRSLQQKDMIYHYAIFELKDLKTKALKLFE